MSAVLWSPPSFADTRTLQPGESDLCGAQILSFLPEKGKLLVQLNKGRSIGLLPGVRGEILVGRSGAFLPGGQLTITQVTGDEEATAITDLKQLDGNRHVLLHMPRSHLITESCELPRRDGQEVEGDPGMEARLLRTERRDTGTVLIIDQGSRAGVKVGMRGYFLKGKSGREPVKEGAFQITRILGPTQSEASIQELPSYRLMIVMEPG